MKSLVDYYKDEMDILRSSAQSFSDKYPALTDLLTRTGSDPDVGQIMQGLAFLTANIKQEMDLQSPNLLQALAEVVAPTCIQPLPCSTVAELSPKTSLKKSTRIKAGKHFDTTTLAKDDKGNDLKCRFRLLWDTNIMPITLERVEGSWKEITSGQELKRVKELSLAFSSSVDLSQLEGQPLRIYLNLNYADACAWLELLSSQLQSVMVATNSNKTLHRPNVVRPLAFDTSKPVFCLEHGTSLHNLLLDFFVFPQKLFFFELDSAVFNNLSSGNEFEIKFQFDSVNWAIPDINKSNIVINAAPLSNVFSANIDPIKLDLTSSKLQIQARMKSLQGDKPLTVLKVNDVESVLRGRDKNTKFRSLANTKELFNEGPCYSHIRNIGDVNREVTDYLSIHSDEIDRSDGDEILRAVADCSNGHLAEAVNPGDVSVAAPDSPESINYRNVTSCSKFCPASVVNEQAWQIVADQSVSLSTINTAEQLKNLLAHNIPEKLKNDGQQRANAHRIEAIEHLEVKAADSVVKGSPIRGLNFILTLRGEHFVSSNDEYVFGSLVNSVLALRTNINSFSQLTIVNATTGESREWPINLPTHM